MAIYQPKWKDKNTGEVRQSSTWWYEFTFAGKRIRESAKTTRKTLAREAEKRRRLELERALSGMPVEQKGNRIKSVSEVVKPYLENYALNHREKSVRFAEQRLAHTIRLLGNTLLSDLTEATIHGYIKTRQSEGASGRTINMELGELSRAIGRTWRELWPKVRKLEERHDVGKALSADEEQRLLAAATGERRRLIGLFVRIALLTGMRSGEILSLTWDQIDLEQHVVTVGRAKSTRGTGRQIPMGGSLLQLLTTHAEWFSERFGEVEPSYYVFPYGSPLPTDPTRPITTVKSAWKTVRNEAKLNCRPHDLRHTAATKMAEAGVPESTMLAIMGHMSRAMLERYSHIRMQAKRAAVEALQFADVAQPVSVGVPKESPKVTQFTVVQ